jgi:hypothetical protein
MVTGNTTIAVDCETSLTTARYFSADVLDTEAALCLASGNLLTLLERGEQLMGLSSLIDVICSHFVFLV